MFFPVQYSPFSLYRSLVKLCSQLMVDCIYISDLLSLWLLHIHVIICLCGFSCFVLQSEILCLLSFLWACYCIWRILSCHLRSILGYYTDIIALATECNEFLCYLLWWIGDRSLFFSFAASFFFQLQSPFT